MAKNNKLLRITGDAHIAFNILKKENESSFFYHGSDTNLAMMLALALLLPFLTGQIPSIGKMLAPMHLPVFLCGFDGTAQIGTDNILVKGNLRKIGGIRFVRHDVFFRQHSGKMQFCTGNGKRRYP